MPSVNLRQISRAKLYAIFKTDEMVQLIEELLFAVDTSLPANTTAVEQALDSHLTDPADAHPASAIANTPAGSIAATTVQAAIDELDAGKQPLADNLTALAALALAADKLIYATGAGAVALSDLTAFARTLLDDIDAATMRATVGLRIGIDVQAHDAELDALAALVSAADRLPYFTGSGTAALATLSAFARTLLDDPDAGTALNTLGVASAVSTWLSSPTSANLRAALTDETGTGPAVFGTNPTISDPELTGTRYVQQDAPTSKAAAATLTAAELLTGIIQYTGTVANLTLPTGSNIDAAIVAGLAADRAFDFAVINTGSGDATILTAAGLTLVGGMVVVAGTSGMFRVRKTAANTFTVYRLA